MEPSQLHCLPLSKAQAKISDLKFRARKQKDCKSTNFDLAVSRHSIDPSVEILTQFAAPMSPKPRSRGSLFFGLPLATLANMSSGIWAAASGAVGQVAQLDTAANNLANLDTPGYRVDRMVFRRALEGSLKGHRPHESMEHTVVRSVSHDMRAGRIVPTGRDLDVALSDDNAFFAMETPQGVRYTRAGSVHVMPDGALAGPSGIPYLGANLRPLTVPLDARSVEINANGELSIDGEVDGQRMMVVQFADHRQLQKEGDVLFRAPREAGVPVLITNPYMQTKALEKSTDVAFKALSEVTDASRNFNMLSKVIEAFSSIERKAANDIHGK
jgi:flagellar basal-body rod protein FlgF